LAGTEPGRVSAGAGPAGRRPVLAASLLGTVGLLDIVAGPSLTSDDPYVVLTGDGVYQLDLTGWVWLDLGVAVATVVAGLLVIIDRRWTALLGIGCAGLSIAIDSLMFPYVLLRAILVVGLSVAAIWLLVRHRRLRPSDETGGLNRAGRFGR